MVLAFTKSIIDIKHQFKMHWLQYILQSAFALCTTLIIFLILTVEGSIIIASLASSIFIVSALPHGDTAKSKNIILGYFTSMLVGSLCSLIPHTQTFNTLLVYSIAVSLSIFIMAILNAKHPPSAGVALSFAIHGFSIKTGIALISCIFVLILIHHLFKRKLKDIV